MCLSDSVCHFLSVSVFVHLCLSLFTSHSLCAPSSVRADALPVPQLLPTYNQLVYFQKCKPVLAESEKRVTQMKYNTCKIKLKQRQQYQGQKSLKNLLNIILVSLQGPVR